MIHTKAQQDLLLRVNPAAARAKAFAAGAQGGRRRSPQRTPRMWAPPFGGASYFGQAYNWEQVLHYKFWSFVAIRAIMREVAGGDPPEIGKIRDRRPAERKSHRVRKALSGLREHQEFEPYPSDHQVVKCINEPNNVDVGYDLWAFDALFQCLTGRSHWYVIRNAFGVPVEIWVIPTHWIQRIANDADGQPVAYIVQSPWGQYQEIPWGDVVSFYDHSPLNRYEGAAVQQAIGEWLDSYEAQVRTDLAVYKNGAMPAMHIALGESYLDPDEAMLNRYAAKYMARFQGEDRAGMPLFTGADVTVKGIDGHSPADIVEATRAVGEARRDQILSAWGVPKGVVCIEPTNDTSAYAPLNQFCRFTVNPYLTYKGQILTSKYVRPTPGCSDGVMYWKDRVVSEQSAKIQEIASRREGLSISPNEERVIWGAEPWPHGGDDPQGPNGPVPFFTGKKPDEQQQVEEALKRLDDGKPAPKLLGYEALDVAPKALGESTGAAGGYTVPPEFKSAADVLRIAQGHPSEWDRGEVTSAIEGLSPKEVREVCSALGIYGAPSRDAVKRRVLGRLDAWTRANIIDYRPKALTQDVFGSVVDDPYVMRVPESEFLRSGKLETVDPARLIATQPDLDEAKVQEFRKSPPDGPALVVRRGDAEFVRDGHHRLAADAAEDRPSSAIVLDWDDVDPSALSREPRRLKALITCDDPCVARHRKRRAEKELKRGRQQDVPRMGAP